MQSLTSARLSGRAGCTVGCPPRQTTARLQHNRLSARPRLDRPPVRRVTCSSGEPESPEAEDKSKRLKEVEQNLKQLGIDRTTARRVLQIWKQAGATSPDSLRKLFYKRSLNKSLTLVVQLVLDTGAAAGAFYTGLALGESRALGTFTLAAEYGAYFIGMYLGISAALDLFGLVVLQVATARYSANADAFLLAVQELAGGESGLDMVNKARKAVSMVKVLQALQSILDMLKGQRDGANEDDFFQALGAYLTLERAQRVYKFDAAEFSLSEAQAAEIAEVFARYDTNDDGLIEIGEFRKLCTEAAPHLSSEEVQAALEVLDTDRSGTIDFPEWVSWWVSKAQQVPQ